MTTAQQTEQTRKPVRRRVTPRIGNGVIPPFLCKLGVGFYQTGTVSDSRTGEKLYDAYFLSRKLTDEQLAEIRHAVPMADVQCSSPMYAPEMVRQVLLIPKAAFYRRLKAQRAGSETKH